MKKAHTLFIVLAVLFMTTLLFAPRIIQRNGENSPILSPNSVAINGNIFDVYIANTKDDMTKGLSARESLSQNEGMLFMFEKPDTYSFWMKDMNFPIDIIWIGEDMRTVYIKENATPDSYPESFTPDAPALYVLEINAGIAANEKIKIGDTVFINMSND